MQAESKPSAPSVADEKGLHRTQTNATDNGTAKIGSVAETNDITQLGYKPEMARNRSMLTLLFQSLAIAAIRMLISLACAYLVVLTARQLMVKAVR